MVTMKINYMRKVILYIIIFFLFQPFQLIGQIILINEMPRALYYERTMRIKKLKDMKSVGDMVHSDKYWLRQNIISGTISSNMGRVIINETQGQEELRYAMAFFTRIRIIEEFSVNTTFYKDFNTKAVAPWTSDFSYSFGRYSWRPKTFSYGYENYENNKYSNNATTLLRNFLRGNFFFSYNNSFDKIMKKLGLDSTNIILMPFFRYAVNYRDASENVHGGIYLGKPTMGLSCRYTFIDRFYIEGATYFYLKAKHKQPWDPDYSYGFGYFDWRPFRMSVTYGNWVINRFPWNEKAYSNYGFLDGNFRMIFNYSW